MKCSAGFGSKAQTNAAAIASSVSTGKMHASDRAQRFDRFRPVCRGFTEANPDVAIRLDRGIDPRSCGARRHISGMRRNLLAVAVRPERPAMIGADQALL